MEEKKIENQIKTDNFIQDWELNIKEKSACHKSGLEIEYIKTTRMGHFCLS
jgi:hypothetical protein